MSKKCMSLFYQGEVSLQIKIGGKFYEVKTHNEGLPYLKYMFAKILCGEEVETLPSWLNLYAFTSASVASDDSSGEKFLQEPIAASGKTYSDALGYYVEFKSYLSSDNLKDTVNVDDTRVFYLYLLTDYDSATLKQYPLARIQVDVALLSKITPGTTGSVVWRMRLLNGGEVE